MKIVLHKYLYVLVLCTFYNYTLSTINFGFLAMQCVVYLSGMLTVVSFLSHGI